MKRYLFSTKAGIAAESVLKGLAAAHMITATSAVVVCTEDPLVAQLLAKLETADEIRSVEKESEVQETKDTKAVKEPAKVAKAKRQYTGEPVECPRCHEKKAPFLMTKAGICKTCRMRELKAENQKIVSREAEKSQPAEKSQTKEKAPGQWTSGMPESDGRHGEHLADILSRPAEKFNVRGLKGRKVG